MELRYVGTLPSGTVPDFINGNGYTFKQGKPVEIPDRIAEELLKTSVWKMSSKERTAGKEKAGDNTKT